MGTLDRRSFLAASSAGLGAGVLVDGAASASPGRHHPLSTKPVLMKLGTQEPTSEANFTRFQRYGVKNVCGWYSIAEEGRRYPTVDELKAVISLGEKYGLSI